MTDIRTDEVHASDIVAMAVLDEPEEVTAGETAEVDEDAEDQTELLRRGEQKREPRPHSFPNPGEGEHQMKGTYAEVNPIGPAMQEGDVRRAISVNVHQHGDVVASQYRDSRVYPGVNEHTDLAIANDTRVAGGRPVAGTIVSAPDPEGIVKEESADITSDLLEQQEEGAAVVLPEPTDLEVPPFTDRIPVMEYDEEGEDAATTGPRSNADIQADKDEAYEEVVEALFPDPATQEEIEEYDATEVVAETDPEALAETQDERSAEEAKAQAEEENITPRPEDINEEEPVIFTSPDTIVDASEQAAKDEPGRDRDDDTAAADADDDGPPPKSANKPEWVDYVVANYAISREDAEAMTKEELVETYGD